MHQQDRARTAFAAAMIAGLWLAWLIGLNAPATYECLVALASAAAPFEPVRHDDLVFSIGEKFYNVVFWCTPTAIWSGAWLLLGLARVSVRDFLVQAAAVAGATWAALLCNTVMSWWLHPWAGNWYAVHIPGTIVIYIATFAWCLGVIGAADRRAEVREAATAGWGGPGAQGAWGAWGDRPSKNAPTPRRFSWSRSRSCSPAAACSTEARSTKR